MKSINRSWWAMLGPTAAAIVLMFACSLMSNPAPAQTATPTSTASGGFQFEITPSPVLNRCSGLHGNLEMQILVGPGEAVGLEPVSVGAIPFTVGEDDLVEGSGPISYDETLEKPWGTYRVSLDLENTLEGACSGNPGSETLNLIVVTSGEQLVEVRSEGFQGDYPWSGTQTRNLNFPLEEGAVFEGEGWAFILHLTR